MTEKMVVSVTVYLMLFMPCALVLIGAMIFDRIKKRNKQRWRREQHYEWLEREYRRVKRVNEFYRRQEFAREVEALGKTGKKGE